jgi:D-threo-aldose 1-dehydrogenase
MGAYDYAPATEEIVKRALDLAERCRAPGVALPAAALQFPLRHPAVTGVVVGARSPREVIENAGHANARIPEPLWQELE